MYVLKMRLHKGLKNLNFFKFWKFMVNGHLNGTIKYVWPEVIVFLQLCLPVPLIPKVYTVYVILVVGGPPGTLVSSISETDISSLSFHRFDMTLAVAEDLSPNKLKQTSIWPWLLLRVKPQQTSYTDRRKANPCFLNSLFKGWCVLVWWPDLSLFSYWKQANCGAWGRTLCGCNVRAESMGWGGDGLKQASRTPQLLLVRETHEHHSSPPQRYTTYSRKLPSLLGYILWKYGFTP